MPGLEEWEKSIHKNNDTDNLTFIMSRSKPNLTKEQEQHLFRQYNFYKYKINTGFDYHNELIKTRNMLILSNIKLASRFITAKKDEDPGVKFSECLMTLIRCIDKFDYRRDLKFSSYCSIAFLHTLIRFKLHNRAVHFPNKNYGHKIDFDFTTIQMQQREDYTEEATILLGKLSETSTRDADAAAVKHHQATPSSGSESVPDPDFYSGA